MARLHVDLICRSGTSATDAIRDHTLLLCDALAARSDTTARAHDLRHLGDTRDLTAVLSAWPLPPPDARHIALLQYNPYSYARRGMPCWLPNAVLRLRRARPMIQVLLLIHELWIEMNSPGHALVGVAQRAVFALLGPRSDLVAVSTERLVALVSPLAPRPTAVLPSGSNLPDARWARSSTRRHLRIRDDQPVVAAFGTGHPSRLFSHLTRAIERLTARYSDLVVLNLGASAPAIGGTARGRVVTPGHLSADDLARHLSTVDLLLLPFSDGVATRRTTVMAGLQHAVPILGTDGPSTSHELRLSRAIALVEHRATPEAYAQRACELLADASERRRLQRAGRALYDQRFAWPVIAGQVVSMIHSTPATRHAR